MNTPNFAIKFAVALHLLFPSAGRVAAEIEAFFTPITDIRPYIIEHLNSASNSVDIAMYSFSEPRLIEAVKAAAQRGVKTRLLLHDADKQETKVTDLEAAGIDVRYVNLILHHKFALIDGPRAGETDPQPVLMTGSGNWSTSMSKDFDEDFLLIRNESDIILSFQAEFNYLWRHARESGFSFFPDAPASQFSSSRTVFTSENMEVFTFRGESSFRARVEGDDGVAGNTLKGFITAAESSIDIATTHFRRPDIFEALAAALARGIRIRILLDGQEFEPDATDDGSNTHHDELLAVLGAEVRYKTYSRYWFYPTAKQMHTKYMIIDNKTVLTGTFNWSFNAEINTFENILILSDADVVSAYQGNFSEMFQDDPAALRELLRMLSESGGRGPCHFQPLPLSPEDLRSLYSKYQRGACWGGQ